MAELTFSHDGNCLLVGGVEGREVGVCGDDGVDLAGVQGGCEGLYVFGEGSVRGDLFDEDAAFESVVYRVQFFLLNTL